MEYKDNAVDYLAFTKEMASKIDKESNEESKDWNNIIIDVKYLKDLYRIYKPNMKLLELGCGVGNVVHFANNIGYKSTGVEIDNKLIKDLNGYQIIHCDIRLLSPYEYNTHDVIYINRPLTEGFDEYVKMVVDNMKVGAYIMTPMVHQRNESLRKIVNYVYQKK